MTDDDVISRSFAYLHRLERERERDRQTDRQTDRHRERERERERERVMLAELNPRRCVGGMAVCSDQNKLADVRTDNRDAVN